MQNNLQIVSRLVSTAKTAATPRVVPAPVVLDAAQLKQVGGGGPNGTWAVVAGPNGTW